MPIQNGKYINPGWMNDGPPAIDDAELNAISDTLEKLDAGGETGGGKRYARVVVGTSTNGWTAEDCDYLCDGVDDDVEIQAAAQQLPNDIGGELLLLDGTYNINDHVSFNRNTTLTGTGRSAVIVQRAGVSTYGEVRAMMIFPNKCQLRDLTVDGNRTVFGSGDWSSVCDVLAGGGTNITNVDFYNSVNDSLYAESVIDRPMIIDGCSFSADNTAIHIDCNGEVMVTNCSCYTTENGYMVRAIGVQQDGDEELPLTGILTVKLTNVTGNGNILFDGIGASSITNCSCHSIILQMTQSTAALNPERGRHILLGNHMQPITDQEVVLTFGEGVNNCIAIGNLLSTIYMDGTVRTGTMVNNGENNIVYNGASGGQVTLSPSGWSSNQQIVTAPGVTTSNYVTTGPTPATFNTAMEAGVYCSGQGNGTLTFTCTTAPSSSITYTYTAQEVL